MNDEEHKHKKYFVLALVAILIALIAYSTAIELSNITNIFEIQVNNTNLAPYFPGLGHPNGTGERISGATYWNNETPIEIFLKSHAETPGHTAAINLSINGSVVASVSSIPLGSAQTIDKEIVAIIPKGASYSAIFTNYHHYEWREYPILSGQNGTLSINQTINNYTNISGTTNHANLTNLNWSVAGHVLDSDLTFAINNPIISNNDSTSLIDFNGGAMAFERNTTNTLSRIVLDGINRYSIVSNINGARTDIDQDISQITFKKNSTEKMAINASGNISMNTALDMQNHSIINADYGLFSKDVDRKAEGYTLGTVYRNNLSRPVFVSVTATNSVISSLQLWMDVNNPPTKLKTVSTPYTPGTAWVYLNFIVPPGYYYKVYFASGTPTLYHWWELQ